MTSDLVRLAFDRAIQPGRFFVAPPATLRIERAADETIRWEVFRGHLLDPAHAGETKRFASWHVFLDSPAARADSSLLTIRCACDSSAIHVTRQILSEAFEAYEDSPGVILSRPVRKWIPELVGTIEPLPPDARHLTDELERLLFVAVIGTSRLPITSLESPLPDFSLGRLAFLPGLAETEEAWSDAVAFAAAALGGERPLVEQAKALELALRADVDRLPIEPIKEQLGRRRVAELLRTVFNTAALSPYTRFVDALVDLVLHLAAAPWFGPAEAFDVLGYMLRNLCRHLTAFDLTLFHNRGANYPDALFLDALLRAYLQLMGQYPALLHDPGTGLRRRRALRQASLVRKHYEGHRVPDAPTSPGESLRVLPAPLARVPQEQILEVSKRTRKLFSDQPTDELLGDFGRRELEASIADLDQPLELRELGMALFLDRPLGVLKEPGEVDRTPLLAYEAFSRSIATRRVRELFSAGWIGAERRDALLLALDEISVPGVPLSQLSARERPGVVSIADAGRAAADFVFLRTTRGSLNELLAYLDLSQLAARSPDLHDWLTHARHILLVQHVARQAGGRAGLHAYDRGQFRLELELSHLIVARS